MDKICLKGIRCRARVGISTEERENGCPCEIDLEIARDLETAAWSDNLDNTLDYQMAGRKVADLAEHAGCRLLETLAERIAVFLLSQPMVVYVRVVVKKKEIPGAPPMDYAAVDITRGTRGT
jgi:dihydroneopterin aldolase